ncbi:hypothetical protein [Hansschlegelia sp. KR7-227]|uniref:hypothetical protein n=1 Tax=Hansschlegelia sp. KR7-227 TaxID=3400914 RepID=UPI003C0E504B
MDERREDLADRERNNQIYERDFYVPWYKNEPSGLNAPGAEGSASAKAAAPAAITPNVVRIDNTGYGVERGEPTAGGLMKRTVWVVVRPAIDGRLVLTTFGSSVDTVLAVYTGETLATLKRVAVNDDMRMSGASSTASLVVFDAVKDTPYRVQIGSKAGAEGDIVLSRALVSPEGAVVAQLREVSGLEFLGSDYVCSLGSGGACPPASFLVVNAAKASAIVTPSVVRISGALDAPAPFRLGAGVATTATFASKPGFDSSRPRAVLGEFRFDAKTAAAPLSTTGTPGTIEIGFSSTPVDVAISAVPNVATAPLGKFGLSVFHIVNNGPAKLTGCHFAAQFRVRARWRVLDVDRNRSVGPFDPSLAIEPGRSVDLVVGAARQDTRNADYGHAGGPVTFNCTGAPSVEPDFDLTSIPYGGLATVAAIVNGGKPLAVPKAGVVIKVTATNHAATRRLTVRPNYVGPFGEAPFRVAICPAAMTNAACLKSTAQTLSFSAVKSRPASFKIAVRPPTKALNDAARRRVVDAVFEQDDPDFGPLIVGAASSDVRMK